MQHLAGNRAVSELVGSAGAPLEQPHRSKWETSFNRDFSDVRIHSSPAAGDVARRSGAVALTVGSDIVLGTEVPDLAMSAGREVLGEELAHVAQGVGTGAVTSFTDPDGPIEQEATRAGSAAAAGGRADVAHHSEATSVAGRRLVLWPYPHQEPDEPARGGAAEGVGEAAKKLTGLTPAQKARLHPGAIDPMQRALPSIGTKDPMEISDSLKGISEVISGTTVPDPEIEATIIEAANDVITARNACLSAVDPEGAMKWASSMLADIATALDGVISAGNQAAAPKPTEAPGTAPTGAPAAPAAPTPGEITQVQGIRTGIGYVQGELAKPLADFELLEARIAELSGTAQTFTDSPALAGPMGKAGRQLEGINNLIIGAKGGKDLSLDIARGRLTSAIGLLSGLAAEQPPGAETPEAP